MKDQQFLAWIHERLRLMYGVDPSVGSMHKLRAIISVTPCDQETPNTITDDSLSLVLPELFPEENETKPKWGEGVSSWEAAGPLAGPLSRMLSKSRQSEGKA